MSVETLTVILGAFNFIFLTRKEASIISKIRFVTFDRFVFCFLVAAGKRGGFSPIGRLTKHHRNGTRSKTFSSIIDFIAIS